MSNETTVIEIGGVKLEVDLRTAKRKGFTSSADVHIGEEVEFDAGARMIPGKVIRKQTDTRGTTTFTLETDGGRSETTCHLGELYRRMK